MKNSLLKYFTLIFITSFSIIFLINTIANVSIPDLSPILFHIGVTLIIFPIINLRKSQT